MEWKAAQKGYPHSTTAPAGVGYRNRGLPEIQVNDRQLSHISAECLDALEDSNDPPRLFARAGEMAAVSGDEHGETRIISVSQDLVRGELTRCANFYLVTPKGQSNAFPPNDAVKDLLARPTDELPFPPLIGLSGMPILHTDGTVTEPGYDPVTKMIYSPAPGLVVPPIPDSPTQSDFRHAADVATEVIEEFPWTDPASFTNTLGLLLTMVVRPVIAGAVPIAVLDAPMPGTGKSLIAEMTAIIGTGSVAAMQPAPTDEAEWKKLITSVVCSGRQLLVIDNLEHVLESSSLCAAATAESWSDRILGRTEVVKLPQRVQFVCTGNNIVLGGDLPRRCYWVRIDAQTSRPWTGRDFRHKRLKQYVSQNRGTLVAALLTMAAAWFRAGQPEGDSPKPGSFEEWARIIGGIICFAGYGGFLANSTELYGKLNPAESDWYGFLRALHGVFGGAGRYFTVREIIPRLLSGPLADAAPEEIQTIMGDLRIREKGRAVGRALRRNVDRRYGSEGFHLVQDGVLDGVAKWVIRRSN